MKPRVDLRELTRRESEQTEWKENVADPDDVVATLSAFASDLQNLGGGYVVCGAREEKDEHGLPRRLCAGAKRKPTSAAATKRKPAAATKRKPAAKARPSSTRTAPRSKPSAKPSRSSSKRRST